jgi:F-type H+-transporting ATPase subunit delta
MAETKVARRYAKSLLDLGKERDTTTLFYNDMMLVIEAINVNRQLGLMFKSPIVNADKKENVIREVFGGKVNEVTLEFMLIITRKKREYYLEDIALAYIALYKVYKNIQPAYVISASPLNEQLRSNMVNIVKQSTGSTVELEEIIDKKIIGGFILRWADRQIDASVTGKLIDLKQDFKKNLYIKDY